MELIIMVLQDWLRAESFWENPWPTEVWLTVSLYANQSPAGVYSHGILASQKVGRAYYLSYLVKESLRFTIHWFAFNQSPLADSESMWCLWHSYQGGTLLGGTSVGHSRVHLQWWKLVLSSGSDLLPAGGVGLFCVTRWTQRCICIGLEAELLKIQGYVKVCVLPPGAGTLWRSLSKEDRVRQVIGPNHILYL